MSKVAEVFDAACRENAKKTAVYFCEKGLQVRTYGELAADVRLCIGYLKGNGVKAEDRVFLFAASSYELVVFMIAAFKLGVQVMFLDIHARQETFDKLFEKFCPKYVLVSNKTKYLRFLFKRIRRGLKILNVDKALSGGTDFTGDLPEVAETASALLTTTTGSTGTPKIAVRTHLDLYNQLELMGKNLPKGNNVIMSTSFIYIFAVLARGDTAVLPAVNLNAPASKINRRLATFEKVPISIIITSPVFGLKVKNIYSELRELYIGGASISLAEAEVIQKKFSKSRNYIVYGATECNIMTRTLLPDYIRELRKNYRSTLGTPFDGVSIKIAEDDSIMVSSNALIKGFVNAEAEYAMRDGDWYDTNDKGYVGNGVLYYRGKYNYYVEVKGAKYYSHEIEQFLSVKFPRYKKCAVIQKGDVVYLFGSERGHAREICDTLYAQYGFRAKYKYIRKLPRDTRHFTKTDYKKLLSLI